MNTMNENDWNALFAEHEEVVAQPFVPASQGLRGHPKANTPLDPLERIHQSMNKFKSTQVRDIYKIATMRLQFYRTGQEPMYLFKLERYWMGKDHRLVRLATNLALHFKPQCKRIKELEPDLRTGRTGGFFGTIVHHFE